jgi:hypothetical protein
MLRPAAVAILVFLAVLHAPAASAEPPVPNVVKVNGTLPGAHGSAVVTFALYGEPSGGSAIWSERQTVAVAADGRYSVLLGSESPDGLPPEVFGAGAARWLGIAVDGEAELERALLVSVPYAMKAADAQTFGGRPLSAFVLAGTSTGTGADGLTYVDTRVLKDGLAVPATGSQSGFGVGGAAATAGKANYLGMFTDAANLGNSALFQTPAGRIGINTTTPSAPFHLMASEVPGAFVDVYSGGNVLGALPMVYRAARGDPGAPEAVQADDILGGLAVRGYGATKFSGGRGQVMFKAAENWTDAANGTYLSFATEPLGASTIAAERMRITPAGKVGIGTPTPGQMLSVAGTVESTSGGFRFPDGTTQATAAGVGGSFTATGYFALPDTTSGNVGSLRLGANSFLHDFGSTTNAFVGGRAGGAFTATGTQNTAVGYQSLYSLTTGINNSAFGANALWANTTGGGNTAIGTSALAAATTAVGNVAVGDTALGVTTTGNNNVALGFHALWKNTTASGNTGFGYYSLSSNTVGQYNAAFGDTSLASNTTGSFNTAFGRYAGYYNSTGASNVYLGFNAGPDNTHGALTNSTAIGANALVSQSNSLVLGGIGANAVNVGIGTSTPAHPLSVVGTIESTSGGFMFPDGTTQATSGLSQASGDARYLQLTGGTMNSSGFVINHSTGGTYGLNVVESGYNGIRVDQSSTWAGIYVVSSNSTTAWGVSGIANAAGGTGVAGVSTNGTGMAASTSYGTALTATVNSGGTGTAANFTGTVHVNGTLTKTAGSFTIDHPLEPERKYLSHSFVESPDMKNVYDGVAVLDADGKATVALPEWFGALNRDFRYQLTAIGAPGPNLYIAEEIADNRFAIAGGTAGAKVSWQVTGIRQDAYANAHRIQVEEDKPASAQGKFIHPELFGAPPEKGVSWKPAGDGSRDGVIKQ